MTRSARSGPLLGSSDAEIPARRLEVGMWLAHDDPHGDGYGEIVAIHNHGREIGDGTVDWLTLRVKPTHRSYSDAQGPYRADAMFTVYRAAASPTDTTEENTDG